MSFFRKFFLQILWYSCSFWSKLHFEVNMRWNSKIKIVKFPSHLEKFGKISKNFKNHFLKGTQTDAAKFFLKAWGPFGLQNFCHPQVDQGGPLCFPAHQNRIFKKKSQIFRHFVSHCEFMVPKFFLVKLS